MACMKLGSKPEAFRREGNTWICTTGLPSDVAIEVGEMSFQLHKFPLLSRSGLLEKLIRDFSGDDAPGCVLQLHDIPGGAKAFEIIAKFCYGVKVELTALNVVSLRCAAEHLQMNENYGDGNLISQTEIFLNDVFGNWADSIKALETCEEVLQNAEELHIVSRCIDSLTMKACADPNLFSWPVSGRNNMQSPGGGVLWNGICTAAKPQSMSEEDWWYEDVSFLSLPLYKRLISGVESRGMKPENIAGSVMFYATRYLPLSRYSSFCENVNHVTPGSTISVPSEENQRVLLEDIVGLLPNQKGVSPTKFLLGLLRTAIILHASPSCRENLEKRVGAQLEQAALEDLLIPNMGYSVETHYDIDCVQRILDHYMFVDGAAAGSSSPCIVEEGQSMAGSLSLTQMTVVAKLVDDYLAEVASDVNLKLPKFRSLAAVIPDYARPFNDGIYHAIDIYLKILGLVKLSRRHAPRFMHNPERWYFEREQLCRLMNCQKLSLEACTHAAQNERLPLRLVVQVLFFEQLRLRTSISGWFFVSDNQDNSQNPLGNLALKKNDGSTQADLAQDQVFGTDDMRRRVSELEKEYSSMRQEIERLGKAKSSWNIFSKFAFRRKSQPCKSNAPPRQSPSVNEQQNHNGELSD